MDNSNKNIENLNTHNNFNVDFFEDMGDSTDVSYTGGEEILIVPLKVTPYLFEKIFAGTFECSWFKSRYKYLRITTKYETYNLKDYEFATIDLFFSKYINLVDGGSKIVKVDIYQLKNAIQQYLYMSIKDFSKGDGGLDKPIESLFMFEEDCGKVMQLALFKEIIFEEEE